VEGQGSQAGHRAPAGVPVAHRGFAGGGPSVGRGGGAGAPVGRQPEADAGTREGRTCEKFAETRQLRARAGRLEEDDEILKTAVVLFAGELDPRNR
jgi:hypothetical protein